MIQQFGKNRAVVFLLKRVPIFKHCSKHVLFSMAGCLDRIRPCGINKKHYHAMIYHVPISKCTILYHKNPRVYVVGNHDGKMGTSGGGGCKLPRCSPARLLWLRVPSDTAVDDKNHFSMMVP